MYPLSSKAKSMKFSHVTLPVLALMLTFCNQKKTTPELSPDNRQKDTVLTTGDAEVASDTGPEVSQKSLGVSIEESVDPAQEVEDPPTTISVDELPPDVFSPALTGVSVSNPAGQAPKKGDALVVKVTYENKGGRDGEIKITPRLSSKRFSDYSNISLGTQTLKLTGNTKDISATFNVGLFFEDKEKNKKYALGRGAYKIDLDVEGATKTKLSDVVTFEVAKSNAVIVLVMYDPKYFQIGAQRAGANPAAWVNEAQSRKASVYYPGTNSVKVFNGGFAQMMGIKEVYQAFGNLTFRDSGGPTTPYFAMAEEAAKAALGLQQNWISICQGTCNEHHGFDYMIALNPIFMGGVALSSGQISGGFSYDQSKNRSQMVISHESGHVYGAPHCDPLQGFMMCSGEKAASYKQSGDFLWHEDSVKAMNPKKFE
jgi:hypothetical protein